MIKPILGIVLWAVSGLLCYIALRVRSSDKSFENAETMKATIVGEKAGGKGTVKQYKLSIGGNGVKKQFVLSEPCDVIAPNGTIKNGTSVLISISGATKDGKRAVRIIDKRFVKELAPKAWLYFVAGAGVAAVGAITLLILYFFF